MGDPETPKPVMEALVEADKTPTQSQAWFASPQVLAAVAGIGGGIVGFCSAFHIIIPYSAAEITAGIGSILAVLGGGFALYRRIKAGLDPKTDAPRITFLNQEKEKP